MIRTIRQPYGWYFAATTWGIAVWAIGDMIMLGARQPALVHLGAELFYIGPLTIPITILFFSILFPEGGKLKNYLWVGSSAIVLAWIALFITNLDFVIKSIQITDTLNIATPQMPGFLIYAFHFSFFFLCTYIVLLRKIYKTKGLDRSQLIYTFIGVTVASFLAMVTNLSLPVMGVTSYIWLGPILTMIFVAAVAFAIIRHRLFDIRLVVARSLAYILTITSVGFVYGFIAFGIVGRLFFPQGGFGIGQQIVYTALALLLVFTFPPIQRFFNRLTNSLFYRDSYDQQVLLDKLGTLFALEIDIKKITRQSLDIICTEMKIEKARLMTVNDDRSLHITSFGDVKDTIKDDNLFAGIKEKVVSLDDLDIAVHHREQLRQLDISIIVRLVTKEGLVGYLLLGPKKSGNIYGSQDIDVLTIISNEMAVAVQNSLLFERITQFNITLQARIEEATRRLRRTNEKLKALDETKDDFISMASHQLRTPLTSIKGYISMVMEEDVGKISKQQRDMLAQAFLSSQRMVYLIADLLNVSRLKTGKFVIERTPVNLAQIVPQEIGQLKETAASRQLTLKLEAPKNFPTVMLDETKTRQVIMNFVDNAIYYTPAGGTIKVRLIDNPHNIELRVEDDGIGVSKADQHHLFTKFYRAGNARKARPDGNGLGLFMAKKVILVQGGSIIFESAEGKGSTFGFTFSKSVVAMPKDPAAPTAGGVPVAPAVSEHLIGSTPQPAAVKAPTKPSKAKVAKK